MEKIGIDKELEFETQKFFKKVPKECGRPANKSRTRTWHADQC